MGKKLAVLLVSVALWVAFVAQPCAAFAIRRHLPSEGMYPIGWLDVSAADAEAKLHYTVDVVGSTCRGNAPTCDTAQHVATVILLNEPMYARAEACATTLEQAVSGDVSKYSAALSCFRNVQSVAEGTRANAKNAVVSNLRVSGSKYFVVVVIAGFATDEPNWGLASMVVDVDCTFEMGAYLYQALAPSTHTVVGPLAGPLSMAYDVDVVECLPAVASPAHCTVDVFLFDYVNYLHYTDLQARAQYLLEYSREGTDDVAFSGIELATGSYYLVVDNHAFLGQGGAYEANVLTRRDVTHSSTSPNTAATAHPRWWVAVGTTVLAALWML